MPKSPLAADLRKLMRGRWQTEAPLAPLTTMRVGGEAGAVCYPCDRSDLQSLLRYAWRNAIDVMALGQGSNVLFPDHGFAGLVVLLHDMAEESHFDEGILTAPAGCRLPRLVSRTVREGWSGLEGLEGIPGSVGGALVMNAGTSMGSIGERVERVEVANREGEIGWLDERELRYGYRSSRLQDGDLIALTGIIRLERGDVTELKRKMLEYRERRKKTQPLATHNSGSIFRNPPGDHAARLIEACGAKGRRVGGAAVSTLHANFIINEGGATAGDVLELMAQVRHDVYDGFGVVLHPEICLIGKNREAWDGINSDIPPG